MNGELWATWSGIAVSGGLAGLALWQAHRANKRTTRLAHAADEREAKRLAIDLEHRKVTWSLSYAEGREDALAVTHVGATPAEDVLVSVRANGWPLRRQEVGRVEPDQVVVVDLAEEREAAESEGRRGTVGWWVRVEWRSPAGAPDSFQYSRPRLDTRGVGL